MGDGNYLGRSGLGDWALLPYLNRVDAKVCGLLPQLHGLPPGANASEQRQIIGSPPSLPLPHPHREYIVNNRKVGESTGFPWKDELQRGSFWGSNGAS